jgi:Ion channel
MGANNVIFRTMNRIVLFLNVDLIVAAGCGYFLLIEISVFLMMSIFYINPFSFTGISRTSVPATYIDFIYFCSITFTSIGFGDILPNTHYTKLLTSFLGVSGQFYTVMLVGILISKFSSKR